MTWDAGRKNNAASFTVVAPSTPANPQTTYGAASPTGFSGLRDDALNWFFGFPGTLIAQRIRHYHWGRYVGQYNPDYSKPFLYQKPSTEQFYHSAQTQQAIDFAFLSGSQVNNDRSGQNIFCGITTDGALWTWGLLEYARDQANPLGIGTNEDFPAGVERGYHSAYGEYRGQASKLRGVTPQPVYGQNDELLNVIFRKAIAGTRCIVVLSAAGSLYCSGNGFSVFGPGDYYVNGSTATDGRRDFDYPKLVKHWSLSFQMVNGQLVGTAVENAAKTWIDFGIFRDVELRAIADDGKLYTTNVQPVGELARTKAGGTFRLTITDAGNGYTVAPTVTASASPTGDTMTLTASVVTANKSINLSVTNWGSGYTTSPTITIAEPSAAEKAATPTWRVATATVLSLSSSNKWASVYGGGYGLFAINEDGELFYVETTSGVAIANNFNRLADGVVFTKAAVGDAFLVALDEDGAVWTMGTANTGTGSSRSTLQVLDVGPWIDIAAGLTHGAMLNNAGEIWCWGQNNYGQLGIGTLTASSTPSKVSGDATWKKVFCASLSTMATRDEQYDAQGNRKNPLAFTG